MLAKALLGRSASHRLCLRFEFSFYCYAPGQWYADRAFRPVHSGRAATRAIRPL